MDDGIYPFGGSFDDIEIEAQMMANPNLYVTLTPSGGIWSANTFPWLLSKPWTLSAPA